MPKVYLRSSGSPTLAKMPSSRKTYKEYEVLNLYPEYPNELLVALRGSQPLPAAGIFGLDLAADKRHGGTESWF
jgi:hypothetical protein